MQSGPPVELTVLSPHVPAIKAQQQSYVNREGKMGASQYLGRTYIYLRKQPSRVQYPLLSQADQTVSLSPHSSPLSPRLWAVGPSRPSLVRGLRPRNAPSPTTSLAYPVSKFVAGPQSKVSSPTTSRQSHQIPVGAGPVPALARPTEGRHPTARPGACTVSRPKTVNNASHRSHRFPASLFLPQIRDAPNNQNGLTHVAL